MLAAELRNAVRDKQIAALDPELAAFQLQAVRLAANTALRFDDTAVPEHVRRRLDGMLRT